MSEPVERPLRRDAEINRQRLLVAAGELLAERGLAVTLNDIAHHAGVGVGTAYRRFANKEEVIDALFDKHLDELTAIASDALHEPDAWDGFTRFLERSLRLQLEDRGLKELLNRLDRGQHRLDRAHERITPLVTAIVERAKEQGKLRPDFASTDAVFIQLALTALMDPTREIEPTLYRRYLTMFLDGARADRGQLSTLPVEAFDPDQTYAMMSSRTPSAD